MKLYYECNFFDEKFVEKDNFVVTQNELLGKSKISEKKHAFTKLSVSYNCQWIKQPDWSNEKPTIIIPIKDSLNLLTITLQNLKLHNIHTHCNIIIVDDRSIEDVKGLVLENKLSYLRVDNDKGFNFSMLNNIPAKICHSLGVKTIILWNSDLWCVKEEWFLKLLNNHTKDKNVVSGSKLVYPPLSMSLSEDEDTDNIKLHFPLMKGKWRETIQFGGDYWVHVPNSPFEYLALSPLHYGRFKNLEDSRYNCDRGASFVTGALQVWDLEHYIKLGGLNPSMSKNFQDVDLCLKVVKLGLPSPMYYGKDIYFYHDESFSLSNNKNDLQLATDHVIFSKIWNQSMVSLLLS